MTTAKISLFVSHSIHSFVTLIHSIYAEQCLVYTNNTQKSQECYQILITTYLWEEKTAKFAILDKRIPDNEGMCALNCRLDDLHLNYVFKFEFKFIILHLFTQKGL